MEFNTTFLQSELFDLNDNGYTILIDDQSVNKDNSGKISLPPATYDGVIEYPYILQRQLTVGSKVSEYLGVPFTWPDRTQFDNLPKNVYGEAIPHENTIKYSHTIKDSYWLQTVVPGHEITHLQPKGLDRFLQMYSVYIVFDDNGLYLIPVPVGQMLVEGGTEVLLEKVKEPRSGYESWYQLMTKVDAYTPVKDLFSTAQNYGTNKVWYKLHSGPMEIIDNYVMSSLKENGLEHPVLLRRIDLPLSL